MSSTGISRHCTTRTCDTCTHRRCRTARDIRHTRTSTRTASRRTAYFFDSIQIRTRTCRSAQKLNKRLIRREVMSPKQAMHASSASSDVVWQCRVDQCEHSARSSYIKPCECEGRVCMPCYANMVQQQSHCEACNTPFPRYSINQFLEAYGCFADRAMNVSCCVFGVSMFGLCALAMCMVFVWGMYNATELVRLCTMCITTYAAVRAHDMVEAMRTTLHTGNFHYNVIERFTRMLEVISDRDDVVSRIILFLKNVQRELIQAYPYGVVQQQQQEHELAVAARLSGPPSSVLEVVDLRHQDDDASDSGVEMIAIDPNAENASNASNASNEDYESEYSYEDEDSEADVELTEVRTEST